MPPDAPLRCLVMGCGSIGLRHIQNLLTLQAGAITAYDPLPERRQAAAALGVAVTETLEAAWERHPEVAFITASTQMHTALALQAARHGCHLFVEKPLAHTLEGLEPLLAEAEQRRLVTMVGCNMRFHPGPDAIKKLLDDQAIGDVIAARIQTGSYLPRWRPQQDYHQSYSASPEWGGAILDCIHELDLAVWYLGPAKLAGAALRPARAIGLEADGLAEILLAHASGALSEVHLNFVQRDYRRTCQIIGAAGTLYWDFTQHQVQVYGPEGTLRQTCPGPAGWQVNQMYLDELQHFLRAVRQATPTTNPLASSLAVLRLALEARQKGRALDL